MATKLKRGAFFTDIHFGRKANSEEHNQDCINFIEWFTEKVKENECDYVAFLGDWYENRTAINILTSQYSHRGSKLLENLELPVYFLLGNHDLYYKTSRNVHSVLHHGEFNNFNIITEPTIVDDIRGKAFFCPYIFHNEYPDLGKYLNIPFWAGHFEFEGFIVTGYNVTMKDAPNANMFEGPKNIVSGHFHKRQHKKNVTYMGNAFPMDFSDADDVDRGMMIYNHMTHKMEFINWEECPKYVNVKLSSILEGSAPKIATKPGTTVNCIIDEKLDFEESTELKEEMMKFGLRNFTYTESGNFDTSIDDIDIDIDLDSDELETTDELVIKMLNEIDSEKYDKTLLVKLYKDLGVEI